MEISGLHLGALRAFEAAARHLSFTRAGVELRVTQAAVSHQVRALEDILGVTLFRRLPRGLALTAEGEALLPVLTESFRRIAATLTRFEDGRAREVLSVGVVHSFLTGWLLSRLDEFRVGHPTIDLRVFTNNNRPDIATEGLDCAIRFGDGAWTGVESVALFEPAFTPVCADRIAGRLRKPADLNGETLLRSYRPDEWVRWFECAGESCPSIRGFVFDSSLAMAEAAEQGAGVALLPAALFESRLADGRLVRPFKAEVNLGGYWLTRLKSREESSAGVAFRRWIVAAVARPSSSVRPIAS